MGMHLIADIRNITNIELLNTVDGIKPLMRKIIQDMKSDNCGYYCFSFLLYMKNNLKTSQSLYSCADKYIKQFVDDTKQNDAILAKVIFSNITKDKPIPIEMMSDIIKSCQKANLKNGQMQVGISIQIPNIFGKQKIKSAFGIKKKGKLIAKKDKKK